jgi:hypothetical protein
MKWIWRLVVMVIVVIAQLLFGAMILIVSLLVFLWRFRISDVQCIWDEEGIFGFPLDSGWRWIDNPAYKEDPEHNPEFNVIRYHRYYRNPIDALLGKVTETTD